MASSNSAASVRSHVPARSRRWRAIRTDFADRILPLDAAVGVAIAHCAEQARPMVIGLPDLIIAATADVHSLSVLTRNLRHIEPTGIAAIDPVTTALGG